MGLTAEALEGVWARLKPGCVGVGVLKRRVSEPTGLLGRSYCLPCVKLNIS